MKVLIADDDKVIQLLLKDILEKMGYQTLVAEDGLQAIQLTEKNPDVQLFIVDWSMPWLDGLELCKRIKESSRYVYFIMISSRNATAHLVEAMEQGVDDFIAKPFVSDELRVRLKVGQRFIEQEKQLSYFAQNDGLTGVWNRRMLIELSEKEWSRAQRDGSTLGIVLLDLDFFKKINDTHGHLVGDEVLKHFCDTVQQQLRPYDYLGRYGGEEFMLILPHTTESDACIVAERIRAAVVANPYPLADEQQLSYTVSIGVTASAQADQQIECMIERADKAVYAAKKSGRNKVVGANLL